MSAPQTNIEKQKRWHRGPLIGMTLVTIFGVGMIFIWLMDESAHGGKLGAMPPAPVETAPAKPCPRLIRHLRGEIFRESVSASVCLCLPPCV